MENQNYLYKKPNHFANLKDMGLSGRFCDVLIKAKDKELRAHSLILAANLKYFKSVLLSMPENSLEIILFLSDLSGKELEPFLTFAYTGEILLTDDNVVELLSGAVNIDEDEVREVCIEYLKIHLKKEQACQVSF
ncbi:zinc finger and BTB domain-containing protein 44-like [Phymastichus coffea]|uniref:zinc finger and BTB domain-containing protein 44-like n=1 Tax=Phymastichus coffea TaxID=108790 RepID=UPI00273B0E26|nr:zinc finger and BTB domain-containing protein 44-like [Phymastichus coffea]